MTFISSLWVLHFATKTWPSLSYLAHFTLNSILPPTNIAILLVFSLHMQGLCSCFCFNIFYVVGFFFGLNSFWYHKMSRQYILFSVNFRPYITCLKDKPSIDQIYPDLVFSTVSGLHRAQIHMSRSCLFWGIVCLFYSIFGQVTWLRG